uniref:phage tail protein n=1 Tax=Elioraea sp. TaxID=2185103 RepID=UPI003F71A6A2
MVAVLRLWMDDKLVYDATGGSLQLQVPGLRWRFYPGDESQLPDPLIEANVGAANAVPHRGLCYLVFEDVPLDAFGNRIPSVSAEVVAAGGQSSIEQTATLPPAAAYSGTLYASDFERATVLLLGTEPADTTQRFLASVNTLTMEARRAFAPSLAQFAHAIATQDGKVYVVHGPTGDVWLRKYDLDTGALLGSFESTTSAFVTTRTRFRVPLRGDCLIARVLGPFGWRRFFLVPPQSSPAAVYCIDAGTMTYVFGSADAGDERIMEAPTNGWLAAGEEREGASEVWYAAPVAGGGIELWRITLTYGATGGQQIAGVWASLIATYTNAALGLTGTGTVTAVAFDYDPDDNALILAVSPNTPGETAICKLRADGSIAWQRYFASFLSETRSGTKRVFGGLWAVHSTGGNQVILVDTRTGATVQTATTSTMPTFAAFGWDADIKAAFYAGPGGVYRRLLMLRQGSDTVPLASIVSALCLRAGLVPGEINTAALTDSVRGFVVARPMPARQAIEPLATAYAFDAVERDDVLVFRKRGGATVATVQHTELVRRGDAHVIDEQRAQDAELPRAISVRHIDPERAYEIGTQRWQRPRAPSATMASEAEATVDLPIVLTATETKAIARRLILAAWRERTRFAFTGTTQHLRLEPTDPATLVRGDGAQSRVRLISAQLGADWTVALEAVEEAPGDYAVAAVADGGFGFVPDALPAPYFTRGFALNLPLLVDADDLAGAALRSYLLAGTLRGQTWRRAEVFRSADGTAWEPAGAVLDVAAWGSVLGAVPVPGSYWTWDDATVLTVQMQSGAERIEGATELEVLNGANLAALVAEDGRVELVQFAIADALGDGRFTLRRLLRGRRGTEDAGAFATGAAFLLLDFPVRGLSPLGALNTIERFRFVSVFQTVQTATEYRRLMIGRGEQPYAPVHIAGTRDGSNNLTVTWVRRTRIGGELVDLTDAVPLGEAAELYEVDIRDAADTATLRTFTGLTSPTVTYTAAQQTADGLTPGDPVRVRAFQISAVVGRGRRGAAIV